MASIITDSFKEQQIREIVKFQTWMQDNTRRDVTIAEALVTWIAMGYAEEYRKNFFLEEN